MATQHSVIVKAMETYSQYFTFFGLTGQERFAKDKHSSLLGLLCTH